MRLRSNRAHLLTAVAVLVIIFIFSSVLARPSQGQAPAVPASPSPAPTTAPPAPVEQPTLSPVEKGENTPFVIKTRAEEVLLHATVVDSHQRTIDNLDKANFFVFEDGQPQPVTSFRHDDIPVSMGLLIDNSGSMREKRPRVNAAALDMVRSSNPQDEVFVVNFNDERYLDQDFTNKISLLKEAMGKIDSKGGTALYDTVEGAADHLKSNARLDKRVIVLVTDGEDNASRDSLEQTVHHLQEEDSPQIFAIGLLGDNKEGKRAKRALVLLAQHTGGQAFFPADVSEVDAITQQVAHDIRNQYTIGYRPSHAKSAGGYRQVRVEARARGMSKLVVRTRTGYYATTDAPGPAQ